MKMLLLLTGCLLWSSCLTPGGGTGRDHVVEVLMAPG